MLKFFKIFIFSIFFIGCSSSPYKWHNTEEAIKSSQKFQTGDIIIKDKLFKDPITWLGHAAVIVSPGTIGDFPILGHEYYTAPVNWWLNEPDRKVIVLRYKEFNKEFEKQFLKNVKKYGNGSYNISFSKKSDKNFYCSKFVWFLYYKTAQDLGYELDLDSDKGLIVFPYDFLNSEYLKEVVF